MTTIAEHPTTTQSALRTQTPTVVPSVSTVVVAVSDSKHSDYAFHWALAHFIHAKDQKIILISVQPPPPSVGYYAGAEEYFVNSEAYIKSIDDFQKRDFEHRCALLRKYRRELRDKFPHAEVEMVVGNGEPGITHCNSRRRSS